MIILFELAIRLGIETGGLAVGPRFDYVSKDDEFIFGIFRGTSFSLFR